MVAADYEEIRKTWRHYNRLAFLYDLDDVLWLGIKQYYRKRLLSLTGLGRDARVLDISTGTGRNAKLLSRYVEDGCVVGLDVSRATLRINAMRNRGQHRLSLVQGMAQRMPFADGAFDAVFCTYGMDTVDAPEVVLAEALRVLKVGGTMSFVHLKRTKRYLDPMGLFSRFYSWAWRARGADLLPHILERGCEVLFYRDFQIAEAVVARKTAQPPKAANKRNL
ncbi:methyltransferase domain-containing protein [Methermicoccus shengliensis]|uniref:Methyltransferase domain-containing protein n=1 Tax=Methermicoccus shengliensis TaxID=660064 RepID=A0A832RX61_9EURY|nr:methyltransferase domain-containing protein [Methermicoccus shengliensis]KUK04231.1 MAG: Phosphatidylethanolamine N-methyltransferase [Euryarchaeota archaeon 55_53]KUK29549.1 MAG: Phosphatidylethanolamine N-methyltransferase [Methanosarcinales archeaon 56_1174]MDI3488278.1 hypothetical protein [Methanosarcinales archaeon]MDN5295815.1 hypothetical protein [Methanosarcinales archaeon]HIH69269.1 methyltransferase domain-containing protein [Methermicoccus shengliensis]